MSYPQPITDDDGRFSFALVLDVARVLARHGYPPLVLEPELLALQRVLFTFVYHTERV